jgi:UDP-3-O-[3-hydroxymyristoyl] glucosamine N-acyltransferase
LAGQVGVGGHLTIADNTQIGGQAGINKDIKQSGGIYTGTPHLPFKDEMKSRVLWRNLPRLEQRVRALENTLKDEESENG